MARFQVLTAADAKALRDVLAWRRRQHLDLRPPATPAAIREFDDTIAVVNTSGFAAPEGGLVLLAPMATPGFKTATRPWTPGHSQIGIAVGAIANGATGRAWYYGAHYLDDTDLGTTSYGDRVGTQSGSFLALHDLLGVLMMLESSAAPTRTGFLKARFIHERGSGVIIEDKA